MPHSDPQQIAYGAARRLCPLARINDPCNPDRILAGQTLRSPTADVVAVRHGETLSGIADRLGVSWQSLARANRIANRDLIHPGQKLRVSDARPAPSPAPADGPVDGRAIAAREGVAIKSDAVRLDRLDPAMAPVIAAVAQARRELGLPQAVITSGNESVHSTRSLHYVDQALDFRGRDLTERQGQQLAALVDRILRPGYDVMFETFDNASNNHLHVEHDPR